MSETDENNDVETNLPYERTKEVDDKFLEEVISLHDQLRSLKTGTGDKDTVAAYILEKITTYRGRVVDMQLLQEKEPNDLRSHAIEMWSAFLTDCRENLEILGTYDELTPTETPPDRLSPIRWNGKKSDLGFLFEALKGYFSGTRKDFLAHFVDQDGKPFEPKTMATNMHNTKLQTLSLDVADQVKNANNELSQEIRDRF